MTAWLDPARLATTGNLAADAFGSVLTPASPFDGPTIVAGNKILVKDNTDPRQNGTWTVAVGAIPNVTPMARAADVFQPESVIRVSEGDRNAHSEPWHHTAMHGHLDRVRVSCTPPFSAKNVSVSLVVVISSFNAPKTPYTAFFCPCRTWLQLACSGAPEAPMTT